HEFCHHATIGKKKIFKFSTNPRKSTILTNMPQRTACTESQHAQVKSLLELAVPLKKIGPLLNPPVAYTTVLKMRRNFNLYHNTHTPKVTKIGRTPKINSQMSSV